MDQDSFIFTEREFEEDSFHAASFVAKYRKVSSLEELKEQLRSYNGVLKEQLYQVINKEYKDFITIATKLDGVDSRVEHLRKPLVELRMDLSTLHDGLMTSMRAIQEKLTERTEVSNKRKLLETCLICMNKLDAIEMGVTAPSSEDRGRSSSGSKRNSLIRNLSRYSQSTVDLTNRVSSIDVFECSEAEKAAHSLAEIVQLLQHRTAPVTTTHSDLTKSLELRANKLRDDLIVKLKSKLTNLFCEAVNANESNSSSSSSTTAAATAGAELSQASLRSFTHCLRALLVLKKGIVVEEVFRNTIVVPLTSKLLTTGKIDGTGGRGTFSELSSCLMSLVQLLQQSLKSVFVVCEGYCGVDLVVRGVWETVVTFLTDKYHSIYSSGIASIFGCCYQAMESFTVNCVLLAGEENAVNCTNRLCQSVAYQKFQSSWKLPLYFQLRMQEVLSRLEICCEQSIKVGLNGSVLFDLSEPLTALPATTTAAKATVVTDKKNAKGANVASTTVAASIAAAVATETISLTEKHQLIQLAKIEQFRTSIFKRFALEICTCFHSKVLLSKLTAKFLSLALRCLIRLEAHLIISLDIPSEKFPKGSLNNSTVGGTTVGGSAVVPTAVSVEDIIIICCDLAQCEHWMTDDLFCYAEQSINAVAHNKSNNINSNNISALLKNSFTISVARLTDVLNNVFKKAETIVLQDCKKALQSIKQIAGKYRMTNKPPPDTHSSYVDSALQPLKLFIDKHLDKISVFYERGGWDVEMVEDLTAAFYSQVQSLMETVKTMDSALLRRSKLRSTNTSNNPTTTAAAAAMTDSEKIYLQVYLDVQYYGAQLTQLGIQLHNVPSYAQLLQEVESQKNSNNSNN